MKSVAQKFWKLGLGAAVIGLAIMASPSANARELEFHFSQGGFDEEFELSGRFSAIEGADSDGMIYGHELTDLHIELFDSESGEVFEAEKKDVYFWIFDADGLDLQLSFVMDDDVQYGAVLGVSSEGDLGKNGLSVSRVFFDYGSDEWQQRKSEAIDYYTHYFQNSENSEGFDFQYITNSETVFIEPGEQVEWEVTDTSLL